MAAGPLLVSEPLQRYRALGLAGDPGWRAAGQLRAAIAARLSREHADLLAIPEVDPTGRRIDWYAPFDGDSRRLGDIGDTERAQVLDKVQHLHGDLARMADTMEAPERSSAERNFARLLRHALTVMWGYQEPIDEGGECFRLGPDIHHERVYFFGLRR